MKKSVRFPVKKLTALGILLALSVILGGIEQLIPLSSALPGIKLGLGNLAIVIALVLLGWQSAAVLSLLRVFLCGILFGNLASLLFSLSGAAVSFCVMALLLRKNRFSVAAVSMAAGTAHNLGQLLVCALLTRTLAVFSYAPVLIASGTACGFFNGVAAYLVLKAIRPDAGRR